MWICYGTFLLTLYTQFQLQLGMKKYRKLLQELTHLELQLLTSHHIRHYTGTGTPFPLPRPLRSYAWN